MKKKSFKSGDWVIGWHAEYQDYKTKAWKIHHMTEDDKYIYPTISNDVATCVEDIRHAKPNEIPKIITKQQKEQLIKTIKEI